MFEDETAFLDAVKSTPIPLHQQVDAVFSGSQALTRASIPIRNVIQAAGQKNDYEQAIAGSYYRMSLWMESLYHLNHKFHFQAALHAARCLYEIWIDLVELKNDHSLAEKFFDFVFVQRYGAAYLRVTTLDKHRVTDAKVDAIERPYVVKHQAKYDTVREKHWGRDGNGKIITPKHWSGSDLAARAQRLGKDEEIRYRELYSRLCWYTHGGVTGVANISADGLEASFAYGHGLCQTFFRDATNLVATEFGVYAANLELKKPIEDFYSASAAKLAAYVQSTLKSKEDA
jgi:hypothetical protein